jgi:hypothetical protein
MGAALLTIGLLLDAGAALAQPAQQRDQQREQMRQHQMEPGMRGPGGRMMGPGMMGRGMMGPDMMDEDPMAAMEQIIEHMQEMMARLREGGPMPPSLRRGGRGLLAPDFGLRVTPVMQLSADDVRRYLAHQLQRQGFERLKVGAVEEVDDATISAEIVTVDDSLVTRLEVDRYTGLISRPG